MTTHARKSHLATVYPLWFFVLPGLIFVGLFVIPTFASFFFSLTRWNIFSAQFIGLNNFVEFLTDPNLITGLMNTLVYAVITCALKVVLGMLLAVVLTAPIIARGYLRSVLFFPVLLSTIGVGITFAVLMQPQRGLINGALALVGIHGPGWLTDPHWALVSVALVDVWKGVGLATMIFIAGIVSIPGEYFEAARVDGAASAQIFRSITLPLARTAAVTVLILSLIGGLRSFDLIWTMTGGGPGFSSDVIASLIYKEYQGGFYGLSTAGNVILFVVIVAIVMPLNWVLNRRRSDA